MKKVLFLLLLIAFQKTNAQYNRYKDTTVFSDVTITSGIKFGANKNNQGKLQDLFLDIYQPKGDTLSKRPVIIAAFGGAFVTGNRKELYMTDFSRRFAKMGYVVISIDYRIGIKNQFSLEDQAAAIYRGTQDYKASIRYVTRFADSLKLDTSRIYAGGFSAGAISAIHATYWSQKEVFSLVDTSILGSLSNATGNIGYPEKVRAVINLFGAICDTSWIEKRNPSMVSLHGNLDNVVPYKSFQFGDFGLYGSWSINERMKNLGVNSLLHTFYGKGHALDPLKDTLEIDTLTSVVRDFLIKDMNSSVIVTGSGLAMQSKSTKFLVWQSGKTIQVQGISPKDIKDLKIIGIDGKIYSNQNIQNYSSIDVSNLHSGIYLIELVTINKEVLRKKIFVE